MANAIAQWHAEHADFSRLLYVLEGQVAVFQEGERPDYGLMLDTVSYLREYPDRIHHPREDAAFARLVLRDPSLRLPVNRLLQEHRVIAVAGEELSARLSEVLDGASATHAGVEAAAAIYLAYYRHHLATEERDILPRAARLLTSEDWNIVANSIAPLADPLFSEAPQERYRELRERIEVRTKVF
jgi:hemerythrin-like domain-containing protein